MSSIGTIYKINVHMEPIDGFHMSDIDFYADFYVDSRKSLRIEKKDMLKEDEDNYVATVNSLKLVSPQVRLTKGQIKYKLYAAIPDSDCENGIRHEYSDETICKGCVITQ